MKYIIEVEEMVRMIHRIVVDVNNDTQLEEALENVDANCKNLDEFVDTLSECIPVLEVNEEYFVETDSIEYYDDYVISDEDDDY